MIDGSIHSHSHIRWYSNHKLFTPSYFICMCISARQNMLANQIYVYATRKSCPIVGELACSPIEGRWCLAYGHYNVYRLQNLIVMITQVKARCYNVTQGQRINQFKKKKNYAPVSQADWCNMTLSFTAGNLFPSHLYIGWPKSSPHRDSNPCPQIERQMTYQLSYPSPYLGQS